MRRGFVALLRYAHSLGFEQNLLTNGLILGNNPDLVQNVWKYVYAVQVSLNGYDKRFDAWVRRSSWRSVLEGIRLLVAEKPDYGEVSIATTLDRTNINDLESIGAILCDLGVDAWILARQVHNGRSSISEDEADELLCSSYEMLQETRGQGTLSLQVLHPFDKDEWDEDETILPVEWITESAARTFLYMSAGGDVYPFPYYDRCPEWMAGNIRNSSLFDLWRSESFTRMRSITREDTGCGECKKVCRLWSRWFNYGRGQNIYESPMQHPTCTSRGQKP
jgi:MoaA/NifB/PqqE/SkfB family radical SAM enzyme